MSTSHGVDFRGAFISCHHILIQGGEDSQDPLFLQVIFRKSDLYLVALLWKMICNLGDPMSLRHPVHKYAHLFTYFQRTLLQMSTSHGVDFKGAFISRHVWLGSHWVRGPLHSCACVAVCYSALQCVAVCCSVLPCVAVCCSVLQRDLDLDLVLLTQNSCKL